MSSHSSPGTSSYADEPVEINRVVAYLPTMIQRVCIIVGWLALAFIVYVTLSPIHDRPAFAGLQFDRFAAFALLGFAFGLAYPNRLFLVVAIVVGSAVSLEALQLLTPDRHGRILDALVKAAGGICGIGVGQLGHLFLRAQDRRDHPTLFFNGSADEPRVPDEITLGMRRAIRCHVEAQRDKDDIRAQP
jgi:VanZ like family